MIVSRVCCIGLIWLCCSSMFLCYCISLFVYDSIIFIYIYIYIYIYQCSDVTILLDRYNQISSYCHFIKWWSTILQHDYIVDLLHYNTYIHIVWLLYHYIAMLVYDYSLKLLYCYAVISLHDYIRKVLYDEIVILLYC